jgi:hypothetical protein
MTSQCGTTKPDVEGPGDAICAACPHPWQDHDRIAARYCTATAHVSDASSRGCVCTAKEQGHI